MTFPQGTLVLAITPTENDLRLDPVSCIFSGPIFGTYEIASGTGQFAGASGGGTFQGRVFALVGRGDEGQCGDEPIFVTQVIRNPGTISIPSAAGA